MSISILDSTNYYYSGQADSRAYSSTGGSNTLMVVVVAGQGFAAVPTSKAVTYNGVSMTGQVGVSPGYTGFADIWTLVEPDAGSHTLAINYSGGSNGGMNIAVYTLSNVSNAPIESTAYRNVMSGGTNSNWLDTLSMTPTSYPTIMIDGFIGTDGAWGNTYAGQSTNGVSSYKYPTGLTSTSIYGTSSAWLQPNIAHVAIIVRELKSLSHNDTMSSSDTTLTTKGIIFAVADTITSSEAYSQIRKVFVSLSDTITLKNRGFFGKGDFFRNVAKTVATWTNINKN